MRNYIQSFATVAVAITLTGTVAFAMEPQPTVETVTEVKIAAPKKVERKESIVSVPIQEVKPVPETLDNETISWKFLVTQGFTRNQAAGIMGNLQQEHNFRTDGDGLAQWLGNRKAALQNKADWQNINVQLAFLMEELNSYEGAAYNVIRNSSSVEEATIAFQNLFERCNPQYCMQNQRIGYAYAILARH